MRDWCTRPAVAAGFEEVLHLLKERHAQRVSQLQVAAPASAEALWWPFTQVHPEPLPQLDKFLRRQTPSHLHRASRVASRDARTDRRKARTAQRFDGMYIPRASAALASEPPITENGYGAGGLGLARFSQHTMIPTEAITVIDSRCGDEFTVLRPADAEHPRGSLTPSFDAVASWWTQVRFSLHRLTRSSR